MQSNSAALQDQINELDLLIQQGSTDAQLNLWEMQRKDLQDQLQAALAAEEKQQATTERVGYILDTMTVEGLTIAEIITNDDEYKLVRKGVQDAFIAQTESFQTELESHKDSAAIDLKAMSINANQLAQENEQLKKDNNELEVKNYELGLENEELSEKVRKVAELQHETNQQIEQQKQHIDELQKQLALGIRGALNVVDVPQDTSKMAAEIIARKVRITNVRYKDENGIDTRIKLAENVLTGETVEYEAIYEKRYIILNAEQAEQYRADEANKKAEQEQIASSIPETKEPDVQPVNDVIRKDEAAEIQPFPEKEVPATELGLVDQSLSLSGAETDEIEREDMKLFPDEYLVTMKQFNALAARVENIERHANIQAVA